MTDSSPTSIPASTPASAANRAAKDAAAPRKASPKSARTRAREFALQALYQHIVGQNAAADIDLFTRDLTGFHKADSVHYDALLHGCIAQSATLDEAISPLLDRKLAEISPIERAILWMGLYEFQHCLDVPWRVVMNEYIEIAKAFGGTDGYKYVNGILDALAQRHRATEIAHDQAGKKTQRPAASRGEATQPTAE